MQNEKKSISRRQFLRTSAIAATGLAMAGASRKAFAAPAVLQTREINFIGWNDPFFPELMKKFEADTGIKVNYDVFPAKWDDVMQKFTLWGQNEYSGIDVIFADDLIGGMWSANGWAEELSTLPAWTNYADDVADGILTLNKAVNGVYRIFFFLGLEIFHYNKDIVPTPPKTWEELVSIGQNVTKPDENIWGWRPLSGGGHVFNTVLLMLNQAGADLETLEDKGTLEALKFIQEWVTTHKITPPSTVSEDTNVVNSLAAAGKAAMWWNYDGLYGAALKIDNTVLTKDNLMYARWPKGPATDNGLIHGWGWMIPKASKKKDLGAELINWLGRPEIIKEIDIATSNPPPLKSMYKDKDLLERLPLLSVGPGWEEIMRGAKFREPIVTKPQVSELWGMFENLGKFVASGEQTPEQAQEWAVQEYKTIKGV